MVPLKVLILLSEERKYGILGLDRASEFRYVVTVILGLLFVGLLLSLGLLSYPHRFPGTQGLRNILLRIRKY